MHLNTDDSATADSMYTYFHVRSAASGDGETYHRVEAPCVSLSAALPAQGQIKSHQPFWYCRERQGLQCLLPLGEVLTVDTRACLSSFELALMEASGATRLRPIPVPEAPDR